MREYQILQEKLTEKCNGIVYTHCFTTGETGKITDIKQGFEPNCNLTEEKVQEILTSGVPVLFKEGKKEIYAEPFFKTERMLIFGGGHIAKTLVILAKMIGFQVVVCDDREEFANKERFPEADEVLCGSFSECITKMAPTIADYCVIVTRGHAEDTTCIENLFQYDEPVYTGLIGSKKRTSIVKKNLIKEGFDEARLERICTPIGLSIGAKTIEEIGISIIAEIIQRRRLDEVGEKYVDRADHDTKVLNYFAQLEEPCAIATIMKVDGSAPRDAGARMAIFKDGSLYGSIGGGCVESMVIHFGKSIIGTGRYQILRVDLDGKSAMAEGMVCGGRIQVLIEDASND